MRTYAELPVCPVHGEHDEWDDPPMATFGESSMTIDKGWACVLCRKLAPLAEVPFPENPSTYERRVTERLVTTPEPAVEIDLQARLYADLVALGYNVRAEVPVRMSRLDLVIYDTENQPKLIIEVKHPSVSTSTHMVKIQRERYESLTGLPVIVTNSEDDLDKIIEQL